MLILFWKRGVQHLVAESNLLNVMASPAELIRTLGSVPISIPIIEPETIPMYQKIASEVLYLKNIGYSQRRIARTIGVHAKVVPNCHLS